MTPFAEKVQEIVKNIPEGSVLTYKEVAIKADNPNAARAVANIMAKNYNVGIPCHRVIRSDGTLGGYNRGGTTKKRAILIDEGVNLHLL
jgi:O-6-methylguanine DNA methyltransferase